jgi:gamma-glutamyltranspeptidase/glutathione hydrolase
MSAALIGLSLMANFAAHASARPATAAIASAHPLATEAGHAILAAGGNAFDAAIAVTAALAVVEPYSSGLGGGGFWLLHRARDGLEVMIDGRERAPRAAHRDMYLDENGAAVADLSINGPLAAGIPGTPAALVLLAQKYARLPLRISLAPAIQLAEAGFPVDRIYHRLAQFRLKALQHSPAAAQTFLIAGQVPPEGHLLRQPHLAATLTTLAERGHDGFYRGNFAAALVDGVRSAGGIWQVEDLGDYRVLEREPVHGTYQGIKISSAALPSSGGVVLVESLNVLSGYPLSMLGPVQRAHLIIEAMRRAYRDRAEYLGDPDFVDMPLPRLTHPAYAAGLRAGIRLDKATPSEALPGIVTTESEATDTTHFSILDRQGNRVAATLSINYPFGSGFVPPGTGVLLNDEMDDFVSRPGTPNAYGLVGAEANAIEPGKRMLSSMTPTFLDDGDRIAILGTPGGSRIISMLLLATLEFAHGSDAHTMASVPRFHHQYLPDVVQLEPNALEEPVERGLQDLGHTTKRLERNYGNMQIVLWDKRKNHVTAAADPRGIGTAVVKGER